MSDEEESIVSGGEEEEEITDVTNRCVWRVACGVRRVGAVAAGDVADGAPILPGALWAMDHGDMGGLVFPYPSFPGEGVRLGAAVGSESDHPRDRPP